MLTSLPQALKDTASGHLGHDQPWAYHSRAVLVAQLAFQSQLELSQSH